jgi:hypothetical protein
MKYHAVFYHNEQIVAQIVMHEKDEQKARYKAYTEAENFPCINLEQGELPTERRNKIHNAIIKWYEVN